MTKLLDKKQTVLDFKLTNYGKYLMSIGEYSPRYYAFYDDNVIYDHLYANVSESQNSINERIKEGTPYIGTLTLFEDIDSTTQELVQSDLGEVIRTESGLGRTFKFKKSENYFLSDVTPIRYAPRKDIFRYGSAIGDALLENEETDTAPAWKVIVLNGEITKTSAFLETPNYVSGNIPQLDITVEYKKEVRSTEYPTRQTDQISLDSPRGQAARTPPFADRNFLYFASEDPIIYVDEVNTEMLSENYDVEVFIVTSSVATLPQRLERKYFETIEEQIVDGIMLRPQPQRDFEGELPQSAVEYYFDFKMDNLADKKIVCRQLQNYNKTSYYIDLDIDCEKEDREDVYYDIYGSQVEPEICLD